MAQIFKLIKILLAKLQNFQFIRTYYRQFEKKKKKLCQNILAQPADFLAPGYQVMGYINPCYICLYFETDPLVSNLFIRDVRKRHIV